MRGYVFVGPEALAGAALEGWVSQCAAHVAALPEKRPKPRKKSGARERRNR